MSCKDIWQLKNSDQLNIFINTKPDFYDQSGIEIIDKVFNLDKVNRKVTFYFDESHQKDKHLVDHITKSGRQDIVFVEDYRPLCLDFGLIFGGDGSTMWANKFLKEYPHDLPLFSFNMGNVGFVTKFKCNELDDILASIHAMANGEECTKKFFIECYPKLASCLVDKDGNLLKQFTSINEVIIEKTAAYSNWMDVSVDDINLITLNADGLIFATQMGSTAYNASVNGPFLFPGSSSFILSAIAPFAINFKSVVLGDKSKVCVKISKNNFGTEVKINSDSNDTMTMTKDHKVCISVSDRKLCILHCEEDLNKQWVMKISQLYRWNSN